MIETKTALENHVEFSMRLKKSRNLLSSEKMLRDLPSSFFISVDKYTDLFNISANLSSERVALLAAFSFYKRAAAAALRFTAFILWI